jgi:hypothetical protein
MPIAARVPAKKPTKVVTNKYKTEGSRRSPTLVRSSDWEIRRILSERPEISSEPESERAQNGDRDGMDNQRDYKGKRNLAYDVTPDYFAGKPIVANNAVKKKNSRQQQYDDGDGGPCDGQRPAIEIKPATLLL